MVKNMGKLNIVNQKLKGKTQQVKGKFENATGQQMKGNIDILKGKSNELVADLKMKINNKN
jgi:uncharacterized protein YjbJ (UPF0337 family)